MCKGLEKTWPIVGHEPTEEELKTIEESWDDPKARVRVVDVHNEAVKEKDL